MDRRKLLTTAGTGLTAYLAGCVGHINTQGGENSNSRNDGTSVNNSRNTEQASETTTFAVVATYPVKTSNGDGYRRQTLFTSEDVDNVSPVKEREGNQLPFVRVHLTEPSARQFVEVLKEKGFTDDDVGGCRWKQNPDNPGWCLLTVVNGTVTYATEVGEGFASMVESGKYLNDPTMIVHTNTVESAEELRAEIENQTDSQPPTTRPSDSSSESRSRKND